MAKIKVLFCTSEVFPFAKTGGLADVSGSLPIALEKLGLDVRIIMPKYGSVKTKGKETTVGKNVKVYFVENEHYFNRPDLYGDKFGDYPDNLERFNFFANEAIKLIKTKKFVPDIIHSHDWQGSLPVILTKTIYRKNPVFKKIKSVFTIHNLAYQGIFPKEKLTSLGLGWEYFTLDTLEYFGKINLMKGAIIYSDMVTTVSPTYAKEILTDEFGCGLEGVLRLKEGSLFGIVNGIDYDHWDPSRDEAIYKNYGNKDVLNGKAFNKAKLQKFLGLEVSSDIPLLGMTSRLAHQKGADLVADNLKEIVGMGAQFVLLGTGDEKYHKIFDIMSKKFKKSVSVNLKFDEVLARRIYAGSDIFLIPSIYEPCGLSQMIALRYGAIPVVRKTGGLNDTINDFDEEKKSGNGFIFNEPLNDEFIGSIGRALSLFKNKVTWSSLISNAMDSDFSWENSAKEYLKLYNKVLHT